MVDYLLQACNIRFTKGEHILKKKFLSMAFAITILAAAFPLGVSAEINNPILSEKDRIIVNENFDVQGIDSKTKEKLIKKLESGELLDSMNLEMKDTAIISENKILEIDGSVTEETRAVYPDGSISTRSISDGTTSCGTGYCNFKGRKISATNGAVKASFLADYSIVNGSYDTISRAYDYLITGVGSLANINLSLVKGTEDLSGPAEADLRFTGTVGVYTTTFFVKLQVGNDSATDSSNIPFFDF